MASAWEQGIGDDPFLERRWGGFMSATDWLADHERTCPTCAPEPDCTWCGEPGTHLGCQIARIEALAKSTFEYVETLDDADMANVYAGRALGLSQAARMLRTEAGL